MIRTPEQQYLHELIESYVAPLRSEIKELRQKLNTEPVKNNAVLRSVMPSLHLFKERRDKLNLTLRQVAKITHVSAATISRIERGEGECSYHNVVQLDDFYCRNGA